MLLKKKDLEAIMDAARRKNMRAHISGALLFTHDFFLQVLEGDAGIVTQCLVTIGMDERHSEMKVRAFDTVDERLFPDWGMQYVAHDSKSLEGYRRFFPLGHFQPDTMTPSALLRLAVAATVGRHAPATYVSAD